MIEKQEKKDVFQVDKKVFYSFRHQRNSTISDV